MSKLIIAGSRSIKGAEYNSRTGLWMVHAALMRELSKVIFWHLNKYYSGKLPFEAWDEVIVGGAAGVDTMGEFWAAALAIPYRIMKADWEQHGKAAGILRNRAMAGTEGVTDCIVMWDGKSRGSKNMIEEATRRGLCITDHIVRI